eukprot:c25091_g1_i4 orf=581-1126(-)
MERTVRAAVEEEQRQSSLSRNVHGTYYQMLILERTDLEEEEQQAATAAAIANAEEAGKAAKPTGLHSEVPKQDAQVGKSTPAKEDGDLASANLQGSKDSDKERSKVGGTNFSPYEGTLPAEFYHYYYGSSADMGTLIEVRRLWDTFILPGGSRIPGHWVQPPPPADNIWGSCLLTNNHQLH